jgi:hypothetical protein
MVGMQVVLVFNWKINERNKMCVTVEPFDAHTKKAIRWAKWLLRKQANAITAPMAVALTLRFTIKGVFSLTGRYSFIFSSQLAHILPLCSSPEFESRQLLGRFYWLSAVVN